MPSLDFHHKSPCDGELGAESETVTLALPPLAEEDISKLSPTWFIVMFVPATNEPLNIPVSSNVLITEPLTISVPSNVLITEPLTTLVPSKFLNTLPLTISVPSNVLITEPLTILLPSVI